MERGEKPFMETKRLIKDAFIELLAEKSYSKITVNDITAACGLSRNTFYYHYQDIPSLLEEILEDWFNPLVDDFVHVETLGEGILIITDVFKKYKDQFLNLYHDTEKMWVFRKLSELAMLLAEHFIDFQTKDNPLPEKDRQVFLRFYKAYFSGLVLDWLEDDLNYDMAEYIHKFTYWFAEPLESLLKRAQNNPEISPEDK
jgi:AcrR family transcriptional regulator